MVDPVFDLKQVVIWLIVAVVVSVVFGILASEIINDIQRRDD